MVAPSVPPTLLASRYRLERRLAQGGMAEVWLATDEALSRPVAVKILKPQLARDAVAAERFRREAVAVAGLAHPNIVAVYDTVEFDGRQAVVMQYVPGRSLREVLDVERRLSVEQTLRVGAAVAGALDAAHTAGLIHRDVKPGNILLTPDGRVLLTDFGIAKEAGSGDDLTSENVMMGTAKYLSPEQVRGRRLDGRADLYSLGLVMYECLAGRVPFQGRSDADTALARLQRDPTPLGRLHPSLPAGLTSLIHRLLARHPADRPMSGAQVRDAIERILVAGPVATAPAASTTGPAARPAPGPVASPRRADAATPPTGATRAARPLPPRADTPPAGVVVRGRPPRRLEQRWAPSFLVVAALLLAAAVAGGLLWVAVSRHDRTATGAPSSASDDTTATGATGATGAAAVEATPPSDSVAVPDSSLRISSLSSFDPRGDGEENDSRLADAIDGDPATAWSTECYQNRYFGAKQGVGVVVRLNRAAHGVLRLVLSDAPWNIDVYVADKVADDVDAWGPVVAQDASQSTTEASFELDADGRYVLLMFREAARDGACSAANPFRAGIAELSVA